MKTTCTALLAIATLLGATATAYANKRIPITKETQHLCHLATTFTGRWESGKFLGWRRAVALAKVRGFSALECVRHLAEGSHYTSPSRRATYARLLREQGPARGNLISALNDAELCRNALSPNRTEWDYDSHYKQGAEARRRGLSVYSCNSLILKADQSTPSARVRIPISGETQRRCLLATTWNEGRWETGRVDEARQLRNEGFTELECARHLAEGSRYSSPSRRATYARLLREQDPAAVARAAAQQARERAEAAARRARELEAAARRARADRKAAAEAAARQAKIEAARLRKLAAEAREADARAQSAEKKFAAEAREANARARAAEAEATAKLEAARKTAGREREAELARMEEQRKSAAAERRMAEAKAERETMRLEEERRSRLSRLTVGLQPEDSYYEVAKSSARLRQEPDRGSKTLQTLRINEQVHVVGILPNGWAQVAEEGEPVGWIYRASLRETGRGVSDYRRSSGSVSGPRSAPSSALFAQNYPFPKGKVNRDAVAVLIGNRDYPHRDVPPVAFAHNDLEVMRQFVIKTLGYREGNVFVEKNASKAVFEKYFGNRFNHRGRVYDTIRNASDVFIYVSGHGVPGDDEDGYILPVDGDPGQVSLTGYNVRTLVENMNKVPARRVTIALDTCFSGISQGGSLIKATSGIYIRPKFEALGRVTLLTAASGKQTASWDTGAQLGLFTRYFIEGMLGGADGDGGNGNGSIELFELKDFLATKVGYQARRRYSRDQIPEVLGPLDRVMLTSLAVPGSGVFSFGDPNLERSLPRDRRPDQRPDQRPDRGEDRAVSRPSTATQGDDTGDWLKRFLTAPSYQDEEPDYHD